MRVTLIFCLLIAFALRMNAEPLEEMEYILRFGFIKGGKATLIAEKEKLNKKQVIHYRMRGRTIGLVDKFFEVNDIYESWVDPETYLPVKSVRNVKEQKYRFYDEVTYDHVNDSLFSLKMGRKKVPANINDLVSVFFYIRQNQYFEDLLAGKTIQIPVFHGDELFIMHLEYIGIETIDTSIGKKRMLCSFSKSSTGKTIERIRWFEDIHYQGY